MFKNFETVRVLPEAGERDTSTEGEFANIIERYGNFCQKNNIYIHHLTLATQFQMSKKSHCNKKWKQSLSNLIKIMDKEDLSLVVIDIELLEEEAYENPCELNFAVEQIRSVLRPYGFSLSQFCLSGGFSKLVFIGDTDDGFAVKHHKEKYPLCDTLIVETEE